MEFLLTHIFAFTGGCGTQSAWVGDGHCDDNNNNAGCNFDGGACCPPYALTVWWEGIK